MFTFLWASNPLQTRLSRSYLQKYMIMITFYTLGASEAIKKSNNPHLAGGEKSLEQRVIAAAVTKTQGHVQEKMDFAEAISLVTR